MLVSLRKILVIIFLICIANSVNSQTFFSRFPVFGKGAFDGRFGVTAGITNYNTDTNYLFSKSGIGYNIGVVSTAKISKRFELFVELKYNRHLVKFVGREDYTSAPEDIKFNLQNFTIPFVLDYNYLKLDDEWFFGINGGIIPSFLYSYRPSKSSKRNYYLEPLYSDPDYLQFDKENGQPSFNAFWSAGLSIEYNKIMCNLRYYKGITDPYRNAPVVTFFEIKGEDSYFELSFTYFFDEKL